ncbi:MAG: glycoside hydrolase family 127 protein [Tepidisphaeraceae bacterium]
MLAAQEKDGYFQTRYTLASPRERDRNVAPKHWDAGLRGEHEGYVAGYFIEMGIAHYIATDGKDRRLFDAALKLADCWVDHIGPAPKQAWYDGHQEMEQALVRLGRFVNDIEGHGKGQKYIDLAKFLLDQRGLHERKPATGAGGNDFYTGGDAGSEYDQSHAPITQQYAAVGHAVRAAYTYSAMADVAMETGDPDYWSATLSIWDNLVNRKYYVTGGIGSGETSEGFGPDYSLPSGSAYVESCSSCGLLFMQYKLNLATHDARYADLYETTLYNAILGDVDLPGENFTYTNSLDSSETRYKWHVCPCCVGNIPRTLLMLPTWMYATSDDGVYVNLFAGSTVKVGTVSGASVEITQTTDYPWNGHVKLTVNPSSEASFKLYIRSPKREVSTLYTATPDADGITALTVNGQATDLKANDKGYVEIERTWKPGDTVELELPLPVQTITPSEKIPATRGRVALRRGPLIYNIETVDQPDVQKPVGVLENLSTTWKPQLLDGVMTVEGKFADGSPLVAIPNYARLNRGGRSLVWMKK